MPSATSLAIASARLLASVRYCASDCDDTAVPPIATRPRMPSAKIRIATIASIRKKPRWEGAGLFTSARTAVSRRCRRRRIARGDLPAGRHRDPTAADLAAALDAHARGGVRDVDRVRCAVGGAAEPVEGNPAVEDGGSRSRARDLDGGSRGAAVAFGTGLGFDGDELR